MWRLIHCQVFADGRSLSGWCLDDVFFDCLHEAGHPFGRSGVAAPMKIRSAVMTHQSRKGRPEKNVQTRKRVPLAECGRATHRVISKPSAPRSSSLCTEQREGCQAWNNTHLRRNTVWSVCTLGTGAGAPYNTKGARTMGRTV